MSYLSWTQFETFASCGKKYELVYKDRHPRAPKGYFIGGQAIHDTIAECESAGWWGDHERFLSDGEAIDRYHVVLNEKFHKAEKEAERMGVDLVWGGRSTKQFPNGEDLAWWHGIGPQMLRRYASLRRQDHDTGWPLPRVEVGVSFHGPGERLVKGYIDQLFEPVEAEVGRFGGLVRDWKTGSKYTPDHPLQLAIYGRAASETLDMPITRGQFVYLRASDGRLVYEVDLAPWYPVLDMLMNEWAASMESGQFIHRPGWQCKTCDVASVCEVGRTLSGHQDEEEGAAAAPSDPA